MYGLELAAHCSVLALGLTHLLWHGYTYSLQFEAGGKWDGYAPGLRQGWLFGRKIDLSDDQWRDFRSNLPPLFSALLLFAALSRAIKHLTAHKASSIAAFYVALAAAFLLYLHGVCAVYVFGLVTANYYVAQTVAGTEFGGYMIWAFNIGTLLLVRITNGFPFAIWSPALAWLDAFRGSVRWHICFNITLLRMLSYALDLHWSRTKPPKTRYIPPSTQKVTQEQQQAQPLVSSPPIEKSKSKSAGGVMDSEGRGALGLSSPRERQREPLPKESDYGLVMCLAHSLYPVLYIAGPIITYQDFVWQLKQQEQRHDLHSTNTSSSSSNKGVTASQCTRYALKLLADLLCIELLTHLLYFNSIAKYKLGFKYKEAGLEYGPQEMGLTGWWVLAFMWLKFASIWRTFRLVALVEGLDPPENMVKCFANNYDVEGFWRGWHTSYNRWLVRYLYIPIGGTTRKLLAVYTTFLFVAIWHDLEWHLIGWASLICLAFVPEILIKRWAATSSRIAPYRSSAMYRHACAVCAAVNIAALMAANLTGFVVGLDGLGKLMQGLMGSPLYVGAALTCFYCAAQVMFVIRERETERNRKL